MTGTIKTTSYGYLMDTHWSVDDSAYVATCEDFPGLSGIGNTENEAVTQAYIALGAFIASCLERGDTLPQARRVHATDEKR